MIFVLNWDLSKLRWIMLECVQDLLGREQFERP